MGKVKTSFLKIGKAQLLVKYLYSKVGKRMSGKELKKPFKFAGTSHRDLSPKFEATKLQFYDHF